MALPINIDELINGLTVEWERIEFKEGWNPEDVIHSICAFANDINNWGGGYIVVGIKEKDGRPLLPPVGLAINNMDKIQKELLNLCNRLKPHYFPIAEPVAFQGKHILIIWVPGGQNRPYQAPMFMGKSSQYAYYIRRFSNTVKAQFDEEKDLISLAGTIPFDDRIHHTAEIEDLKLPLIQSFLHEVKSELYKNSADMRFEQLCRQMIIVDGTNEYLKPRNVGLLLFNDMPQNFIPMSQIEVVQFKNGPGDDHLEEKIFKGPIDQQIRDVLTYLKNMVLQERIKKLPDQAEAVRSFNYPYVALEESIVNAVYHRDYEIREPVEIRVYPDKIQILSFPGPDKSIKKSDMEKGEFVSRRYRNRRIGEFLKELKLTEGRSTGIPKITRAMKNNGSPEPIFETDDERSYFLTTLKIHPWFIEKQAEVPVKVLVKVPVENISLNETERKIILLCKDKELSKKEIVEKLGYEKVYGNLKKALSRLISLEILVYTIPDKPNSRNQRYNVTAKGKELIK